MTFSKFDLLVHRLRRHVVALEMVNAYDLATLSPKKAARLSGAIAELRKVLDDLVMTGPDDPPKPTPEVLDLIWRHTHLAYRKQLNGVRHITVQCPNGASLTLPLQSLSPAELQRHYQEAKARAARGLLPY